MGRLFAQNSNNGTAEKVCCGFVLTKAHTSGDDALTPRRMRPPPPPPLPPLLDLSIFTVSCVVRSCCPRDLAGVLGALSTLSARCALKRKSWKAVTFVGNDAETNISITSGWSALLCYCMEGWNDRCVILSHYLNGHFLWIILEL